MSTPIPIRIDFYLLKQADEAAQLQMVCRIVEKAYLKSHQVYIYCPDAPLAEKLDKLLWTFHDTSFIPHQRVDLSSDAAEPVLIGLPVSPIPAMNDILVNIADAVPVCFKHFRRIVEVVPENPASRETGREKYRFYRDQQCELHSHQL